MNIYLLNETLCVYTKWIVQHSSLASHEKLSMDYQYSHIKFSFIQLKYILLSRHSLITCIILLLYTKPKTNLFVLILYSWCNIQFS
jgi:hypothetical protein